MKNSNDVLVCGECGMEWIEDYDESAECAYCGKQSNVMSELMYSFKEK